MAVQNSLTQRKPTFTTFLSGDAVKRKINTIIGGKDGQLFITAITSAVSTNPALAECDNSTILSAALLGASLKLSPSPQLGQYYIVPYNDKKRGCKVAQFQLGYKGYIQLAIRSGQYKKLNVLPIKQGELVHFDPLNEEIEVNLIDDEFARENAPTAGYYAMFEYTNGFKKGMYWSREKMMAHADKYSPAFSAESYQKLLDGEIPEKDMWKYSSFWYRNFDDMACKTMLRQLISRWGVMSIEMQQALSIDEHIITEDGTAEPAFVEDAPEPGSPIEATGQEVHTTPPPVETPPAEAENNMADDFFQD
ncbi:MAG: recombinase RecT [Oscillospiraceae bacterium]|jgi:recombinase, phage recT family|nr:recombinase RecT [Oscillospiraceae bacterium]HIV89599.1 recombinase RecT [Candidatus Ruthenibacterium merdipullorum]